jgi:hypothetical protein
MSLGKNKVLWFAAPGYQGPIAIRTVAIPGMGLVEFYGTRSLVLTSADALGANGAAYPPASKAWRAWPTSGDLASSGCYGFQVDTTLGSEFLTILAVNG